jgi:hypothetical protein
MRAYSRGPFDARSVGLIRNVVPFAACLAAAVAGACSDTPAQPMSNGATAVPGVMSTPMGTPAASGMPAGAAGSPALPPMTGANPGVAPMPVMPMPMPVGPGAVAGAGATEAPPAEAASGEVDPTMPGPALEGSCPDGFTPQEGSNVMFPSMNDNIEAIEQRQFEVRLPADMSTPRPVILVLTGTEESTNASLDTNSGRGDGGQGLGVAWPAKGWIAVAPVRRCSRDANDGASASNCAVAGTQGFTWPPWNEGAANGSRWVNEEGPDAVFFKEMIKCVAATWPVDASRLFVTGVSSGGTMTHRLLTYQSDFWAGGMPESGEWYANMSLQGDSSAVVTGRCCPVPLRPVSNLINISIWEGPNDTWPGADYRTSAQAASNYFTSDLATDVIQISCNIMEGGHHWQYVPGFNDWAEKLFYSHPKGATKGGSEAFMLPEPAPGGMGTVCEVGVYTTAF